MLLRKCIYYNIRREREIMAVRDYREMYISTILTMSKNNQNGNMIDRSYLAKLSFDELKELAEKLKR